MLENHEDCDQSLPKRQKDAVPIWIAGTKSKYSVAWEPQLLEENIVTETVWGRNGPLNIRIAIVRPKTLFRLVI